MPALEFPARYEALRCLGTGGGGEVWCVRDRHTDAEYALKVLAADATEGEMSALVREAVALSGLEGLGVPAVLAFGRLPKNGRHYLVREMVHGSSLQQLMEQRGKLRPVLLAIARSAEQLTHLHRAGFFHGDIKPANIIVAGSGRATLVDLGLAAPWRDGGAKVRGLTPKYASPELRRGGALTARAEVYALGVTLAEALDLCGEGEDAERIAALREVSEKATLADASQRHPSADEFASALRRVAGLGEPREEAARRRMWPIVGIEATASRLQNEVASLEPGAALVIDGASGSGRSALLRRLAWSLGTEGIPLVWIDGSMAANRRAVRAELTAHASLQGVRVLVDDASDLTEATLAMLEQARKDGAVLVLVGGGARDGSHVFSIPALGKHAALQLVRRAIPSLTERLALKLIEVAHGRPGELRRCIGLVESEAVVTEEEIDSIVGGAESSRPSNLPEDPLQRAHVLLDRGRYNDARAALDSIDGPATLESIVERGRLEVGLGEANAALALLKKAEPLVADAPAALADRWKLWIARAHVGVGDNSRALELLSTIVEGQSALAYEARAYEGLALSYFGDEEASVGALGRAVSGARSIHERRVEALALACLGFVQQRYEKHADARETYRQAITAAQAANDAGTLGTVQLNLAVLLQVAGDIAGALQHFEAAVDMGARSGRRATLRQALFALAATDLHLGRFARARASIEKLEVQREQLSPREKAHLLALQADLLARTGDPGSATAAFWKCADAYHELGMLADAAEARLEGVLTASREAHAEVHELNSVIAKATAELGDSAAHRALLLLATARVQLLAEDEIGARASLDAALDVENKRKDWIWRTLEVRAEVEAQGGQPLLARRDREEALGVLEQIAASLPRDLREVFWNDSRRRSVREAVEVSLGRAVTQLAQPEEEPVDASSTTSSISSLTRTPLEHSLARILELNTELLGELDIERLTSRVTEYAVELLKAERGFVLLRQEDGSLSVHASRSRRGDAAHADFSRSIAERVVASGEPVVSLDARQDSSMRGYKSVHQLMLESVACVPITSRGAAPIGALYIEARQRPGRNFQRDIPTLRAFADQVALALDTARLVSENQRRADELARANEELETAKERLKELLGERTEKLKQARQKLRDAHHTLYGHFGYRGMVGTSAVMRKMYALIDRIRDTDVPILITGESGTGKELAARAIHDGSPRSKQPFIGVNCGAIPEHLLESELFGHVRGAFTGADRERKGVIRDNTGGTILLDEIGEMPHRMQAGLLRVLQEGKVRPVGGATELPVDVRFVFATHRNLEDMVEAQTFREDLYYRIHVVQLELPSLRERLDDIPLLVDHFFRIFAARYKRDKKTLSRAAMRRLMGFEWPGNVRQLEHVLLNAWILSDDAEVDVDALELPDGGSRPSSVVPVSPRVSTPASELPEPTLPAERMAAPSSRTPVHRQTISGHKDDEKQRILAALERCNWNRVRAAEALGMARRTLYRRLREYDIQ